MYMARQLQGGSRLVTGINGTMLINMDEHKVCRASLVAGLQLKPGDSLGT
jgi:hypothetical protein